MVNTRILEKRLGWGRHQPGSDAAEQSGGGTVVPLPESRGIGHAPLLQGRVAATRGGAESLPVPRQRTEALWLALPGVAESTEALPARHGSLHSMDASSAAAAALDALRAKLLHVIKDRRWRRVGVTAPLRESGATFVAAGLAASLARLASLRVVLLDMDLDAPSLAERLELPAPPHFADVLRGEASPDAQLQRIGHNLAIMTNDAPLPDAAELVHGAGLETMMRSLAAALMPDLIIVDLPPLRDDGNALAMLQSLDTVLLVADGTRNTARDITQAEAMLEGTVPLLGIVLNKSEDFVKPASRRTQRPGWR